MAFYDQTLFVDDDPDEMEEELKCIKDRRHKEMQVSL